MTRILIAVAAAGLFTTTVTAQPAPSRGWNAENFWRGAPTDLGERNRIAQERVDRAAANGSLDRREAQRVNAQLYELRSSLRQMRAANRGGILTPSQRDRAFARLDQIVREIHWLTHN